jgi:hypothetical protein
LFLGRYKSVLVEEDQHLPELVRYIHRNPMRAQEESILEITKRGQINEPRNIALYLARKRSGLRLEEIGKEFRLDKYSSASSVLVRTEQQLSENKHMLNQVKAIILKLQKSQAMTPPFYPIKIV